MEQVSPAAERDIFPAMKIEPLIAALALLCAACQPADTAPAEGDTPSPVEPTPLPGAEPSPQEVQNTADFVAQGNEPFWRIATEAGSINYSSPEHLDGVELPAERSTSGEWQRFEAQLEGEPMILEVRRGQCFDDMSGFEFSHEARFSWQGGQWRGCARLSTEPQPTENTE